MADEAALDQALSDLGTQVDELAAAAQTIVEKVSNLPDAPDLTDEIATIQGFGGKVSETTAALKDAAATDAEPTNGGTVEEPPVEEEPV